MSPRFPHALLSHPPLPIAPCSKPLCEPFVTLLTPASIAAKLHAYKQGIPWLPCCTNRAFITRTPMTPLNLFRIVFSALAHCLAHPRLING